MKIKTVSAVLCGAILFSILAACGGGSGYRNDVPVSELVSAVETELALTEDMIEAPGAYVSGTMQLDVSQYEEYSIRMNSRGVNIDEFGVFKAKDAGQAAQIKTELEAYLKYRLDIWMSEYMPEEKPKLDTAEIKVMGSYVVYLILSGDAKTAATGVFEEALKS